MIELDWLWIEHAFVSSVCLCMRQSSACARILSIPVMTTNVLSKCSALLELFLFWFFSYWNQTVLQTYDHDGDDDDDDDDADDDDEDDYDDGDDDR